MTNHLDALSYVSDAAESDAHTTTNSSSSLWPSSTLPGTSFDLPKATHNGCPGHHKNEERGSFQEHISNK